MKQLLINTALTELGVGLLVDGQLFECYEAGHSRHSSIAMLRIEELLAAQGVVPKAIDEIIVVTGPGAFTGVRIGVTIAKTWGFALGTPVKAISSLAALAVTSNASYVLPVLDAKRAHVFAALFHQKDGRLEEVAPIGLYTLEAVMELARQYDAEIVGEAVDGLAVNVVLDPLRIQMSDMHALAVYADVVADIDAVVPQYYKKSQAEAARDGDE